MRRCFASASCVSRNSLVLSAWASRSFEFWSMYRRGQSLRHLPSLFGVVADVAHAKRVDVYPHRARVDVTTHRLDDILHDPPRSLGLVQIHLLDDPFQPGAAENLIGERRKPLLDRLVHRRLYVVVRHLLRDDHDQRLGAISFRGISGEERCEGHSERERDENQPATPGDHADDLVERIFSDGHWRLSLLSICRAADRRP